MAQLLIPDPNVALALTLARMSHVRERSPRGAPVVARGSPSNVLKRRLRAGGLPATPGDAALQSARAIVAARRVTDRGSPPPARALLRSPERALDRPEPSLSQASPAGGDFLADFSVRSAPKEHLHFDRLAPGIAVSRRRPAATGGEEAIPGAGRHPTSGRPRWVAPRIEPAGVAPGLSGELCSAHGPRHRSALPRNSSLHPQVGQSAGRNARAVWDGTEVCLINDSTRGGSSQAAVCSRNVMQRGSSHRAVFTLYRGHPWVGVVRTQFDPSSLCRPTEGADGWAYSALDGSVMHNCEVSQPLKRHGGGGGGGRRGQFQPVFDEDEGPATGSGSPNSVSVGSSPLRAAAWFV
eukprot:COSAG01_NODE_480_length_16473_cov_655.154208_12_plen_352_part_00